MIRGRLIIPDGWVPPENIMQLSSTEENRLTSIEELEPILSSGAVFLPYAGCSKFREYIGNEYTHFVTDKISCAHYFIFDHGYRYDYVIVHVKIFDLLSNII